MDLCGQHGMKKRFIYVHYAFIDGITKLQNKSCYFKLETQLVLFQNIGAAFTVKLFRPTLWRWRYYPVEFPEHKNISLDSLIELVGAKVQVLCHFAREILKSEKI